jgi:hypothetical protein
MKRIKTMARPISAKKKVVEETPKKKSKVEREEIEEVVVPKKRGRPAKPESEKKKPVKKETEGKKEHKGRPKGVKYVVPDKNLTEVDELFDVMIEAFDETKVLIKKLFEKGSKSAIKDARAYVQSMIVTGKDLRKALQKAKEAIQMLPAD